MTQLKTRMDIQSILKRFVTEMLPLSVQLLLTRRYYLHCVARITESSESSFSIIKHLVSRGDRVMDIGANIGTYAKFLSNLVGPSGFVYSVEPLPRNLAILDFVKQRLGLVIEVSSDPDDAASSAADLFRVLADIGYAAYAWDEHKVRLRVFGEHYVDYFFLTAEHVAFLESRELVRHALCSVWNP